MDEWDERGIIIVVDDHAATRELLLVILEQSGHCVRGYASGAEAIEHLTAGLAPPADVVIAEPLLAEAGGIEVLRVARGLPDPPEVIMLAGCGSLESSIAALRLGAADYILKPASPEVILRAAQGALARRVERRQQRQAIAMIQASLDALRGRERACLGEGAPLASGEPALARFLRIGQLTVDRMSRAVSLHGREVDLTATEYKILIALATAPAGLANYQALARQVHGKDLLPGEAHQLLKTHVHNMRQKLAPDLIVNIRGAGYRLVADGGGRAR